MANPAKIFEQIGRRTIAGLDEMGYAAALFCEAIYWTLTGWRQRQPVRLNSVMAAMAEIGVAAMPIATLLAATIGLMLAIQSLYSLGLFGAEAYAYIGIALSVVREFSPMIMGILVAGRSGSAIAARLATMNINQEVDALMVMGINPVRFLVSPVLIALVIMMPCLAMWANLVSILAAGLYVSAELNQSFGAYLNDTMDILKTEDVWHGLGKAALFGIIIALVGVVNGSLVKGGAEGVGRVTTRSVVLSVTLIVVADMVFAYMTTR
ncbi:phospholipid/cholesterol/gamma-HCH transport system permease protein [Dongia mobilis]|uniref:Phospholipid/cholesterol/gamma-HCH transport system permease protein n=1 Tax=Dongia mobilis TaxID=578943 RepID=A0A4R6WTZ7_9PROT|nr:ABC transporter permease [Dongia mobilis]TDQ83259.1 phospholipid/cholesterol/gamma-HCH transport system permease protein [Dongia mobilis]